MQGDVTCIGATCSHVCVAGNDTTLRGARFGAQSRQEAAWRGTCGRRRHCACVRARALTRGLSPRGSASGQPLLGGAAQATLSSILPVASIRLRYRCNRGPPSPVLDRA